jgi:hypothetical protein
VIAAMAGTATSLRVMALIFSMMSLLNKPFGVPAVPAVTIRLSP